MNLANFLCNLIDFLFINKLFLFVDFYIKLIRRAVSSFRLFSFLDVLVLKFIVFLKIYTIAAICCIKQLFLRRKLKLPSKNVLKLNSNGRRPLAIITGATGGIGSALCELLVSNFNLILVGRQYENGVKLAKNLCRKYDKNKKKNRLFRDENDFIPQVRFYYADLSSRRSIDSFLQRFDAHFKNCNLNLLVNNAGIMMPPYSLCGSRNDIELQWAVNFLAPVYLADRLRPYLRRAREQDGFARVVNVASAALYASTLTREYLSTAGRCDLIENYSPCLAYANSKLALAVHTNRYGVEKKDFLIKSNGVYFKNGYSEKCIHNQKKEVGIDTCCVHPGVVATDLYRYSSIIIRFFVYFVNLFTFGKFILSPKNAAEDVYWACLSPEVTSGVYYENGRPCELPQLDEEIVVGMRHHLVRQNIVT